MDFLNSRSKLGISRNIPGFADKVCSFKLTLRAIVTGGSLRNAVPFGPLLD